MAVLLYCPLDTIYNQLGDKALGMSVREFLDWVPRDVKTHPTCEQAPFPAGISGCLKEGKQAQHSPSLLPERPSVTRCLERQPP